MFRLSALAPIAAVILSVSGLSPSTRADSEIVIRLSYKVIRDPTPSGINLPFEFNPSALPGAVDGMNALLQSYGRGYRFEYSGDYTVIGSVGGVERPDPGRYFDSNVPVVAGTLSDMTDDAIQFPTLWDYDPNAINIVINNGTNDTHCVSTDRRLMAIGASTASSPRRTLHHILHSFGLCNTQGCSCNCCDGSGECGGTPGNDGIADTLPDLPCWQEQQISQFSFGVGYVELDPPQQTQVRRTFNNIMSYRGFPCGAPRSADAITEGQLDRWADHASLQQRAACDGVTYFVDGSAPLFQNGRSTNPFARVSQGISAANSGGDIVLIRGGSYPERLTITRPVTLRAPRDQVARIGG